MVKKKTAPKAPVSLKALLPSVLQGIRQDADAGLLQVWDVWAAAVGTDIAENARPAAFKGDLLVVHVANSVWCHHLQFLKAEMLQQLNQALGAGCVRDITFKIGHWSNGPQP